MVTETVSPSWMAWLRGGYVAFVVGILLVIGHAMGVW